MCYYEVDLDFVHINYLMCRTYNIKCNGNTKMCQKSNNSYCCYIIQRILPEEYYYNTAINYLGCSHTIKSLIFY